MSLSLFRLFNGFICGTFIASTSCYAMEENVTADFKVTKGPSTTILKPSCEPLPTYNQAMRKALQTPVHSLLNLEPLYRLGLSGHGQIGAVIEPGGFAYIPPGMSGVILNSIDNYGEIDDHASMVAQVVGSQIPGIGIAPGARVFLGSPPSTLDGKTAFTYTDVVKLAIRAGAKAINFSFKQYSKKPFFKKEEKEGKQKGVDYDFTSAIQYALRRGIPVFTSGGNHAEDLETTKDLQDIIKKAKVYNEELLVIAGGFEYLDEVFGREEIVFASDSARVNSKDFPLKRLMMTGPYKVKVYRHESMEDRKKQLLVFRKRVDAEEFRHMWVKGLLTVLLNLASEDISNEDLELIKSKLARFENLFDADDISFTRDDCEFFVDQSKRTDFPLFLRKEFRKFACNFLSLRVDLLTSDETPPSAVSAEERHRLEENRKKLSPIYDPAKVNGEFEKYIMAIGKDERPIDHAFSLETVCGTSYSSPALMSVFLLLNEYSEREGSLLEAEDILACMRSSAWKKPYADVGEDLAWYGCGVVDGSKALKTCQLLLEARKLSQQHQYKESLKSWKNFLKELKGHAKRKYILELTQAFKSSITYQELHATEKEPALEEFYKEYLSFWPQAYESHLEDKIKAFMLFESGKDEEMRILLKQMNKKTEHIEQRKNLVEEVLSTFLNKKDCPLSRSFMPVEKRFDLWFDSFTKNELTTINLSLEVCGASSPFSTLLNEIEKGWTDIEKLNFENVFNQRDADTFLSTIMGLPKKMERFSLSNELRFKLDGYVERAKKIKEKLQI